MHVKDLVFVITGGAGGLGSQAARSIISKGGFVSVFDVDEERLNNLVKECGSSVCFSPGTVDVTSESQVENALKKTRVHFSNKVFGGAILCGAILFNPLSKRGYGPKNALTSYDQFQNIIKINLLGTYCVAQKVSEYLIENKPFNDDGERGILITLSSIAGLDGIFVDYGTSKAAIAGLTLPLANELAPFGIRVMSIAPGVFDTPMTKDLRESIKTIFPARLGQPHEFASLVLGIIETPMLNGTVIRFDGAVKCNI